MITIKDVSYARGYSSTDHPLDDGELRAVVGREFRSIGEARKEAAKLATSDSPVVFEILFADGTTKTVR